jgi:polyisoprenyl-teichoic acid--peptidoglycan teichoic acid transferase
MASDDSNSNFNDKDDQSENDDLFSHYSSKSDDEFKDPDVDDDRNQPFKERERNGKENENLENDFFKDSDFEFKDYEDEEYGVNGVRNVRVKSKRKRRRIILSTILIMSILVVVAIGIVFGYRYIKNKFFSKENATTSTTQQSIVVPSTLKLGKDLSIVISCAGNNLLEPELNSVIFSKYSSVKTEMITLCVPINTLMEIPGFGLDSVNKSVEFGGMDLLKLTLKNTLGMDVNNYMLMDIVNIVNKLEGMNLKLDENITITASDGSKIELKQGDNIINGDTALSFLNYFSGINADVPVASVSKQKILLDSLAKKIIGEKEGDLAKNFTKINDYIDTDLNLEELSELVSTIAGLDSEKNKSYALEGSTVELEGKTFYVPDVTRVADIFNQQNVIQNGDQQPATTGDTLTLSVLNGVGIKGIAGKTSELLKGFKFGDGKSKYSVTTVGDADNYKYAVTQIILKSGEQNMMTAAEDIKKILKVGNITTQEGSTQSTDIVVIIGKDFNYESALASISETSTEETAASTSSSDTQTTESTQIVFDVNILNGEGTQGIAATVKGILEDSLNKNGKTIKVVEATNADNFSYSQTKIITFTDKEGIQDIAKKIKDVLGVGVISSSTNNVDKVDITVIIGSDYTK